MTWVDWVIVVFVALGVARGFRSGFLSEAVAIAAYVLAWVVAIRFSAPLGTELADRLGVAGLAVHTTVTGGLGVSPVSPFFTRLADDAAFVILFLLCRAIVGMFAGYLSRLQLGAVGSLNRVFGGGLGGLRNFVVVLILWTVLAPYLVRAGGPSATSLHASAILPFLAQLTAHIPLVGPAAPVGGGVS